MLIGYMRCTVIVALLAYCMSITSNPRLSNQNSHLIGYNASYEHCKVYYLFIFKSEDDAATLADVYGEV